MRIVAKKNENSSQNFTPILFNCLPVIDTGVKNGSLLPLGPFLWGEITEQGSDNGNATRFPGGGRHVRP